MNETKDKYEIKIEVNPNPKPVPTIDEQENLGFGRLFTNHMFIANYREDLGWHDPRVVPYAPISLDPATMIFHYGQAVFEGMKAYRQPDGTISLFRPELNFERINHSAERMGMPSIDPKLSYAGLRELLNQDADWVPNLPGSSLYIRPFIIATEVGLGVRTAKEYYFIIILSPSGNYYPEGLDPVSIYVEDEFVRAVRGGTGQAKTPGNYAASILAQEVATEAGYTQVLWLDGIKHETIEEVGSMNVFFVIDGEVHTPALNGSILQGITRRSVIELLQSWDIPVIERPIPLCEMLEAMDNGRATEAFGSGTAAVISPMASLYANAKNHTFGDGKIGPLSRRLYDALTGLQFGTSEDPFGWNTPL